MELKDRIKKKADEMFRKYGIRSVTMDEIARQLGVSKKTIYQSYSDKDELVDAVITDMISVNQECCIQERGEALNAVHEVFLAVEMVQEMFASLNPSILYDLERGHPKTFQKFHQHRHKFLYQIIKDNIERGKKEKLYRSDILTDVAVKVRLETMMLPFNQEVFPKSKYNIASLVMQLAEYFLYGIATSKGAELVLQYQKEQSKKSRKNAR